MNIRKKQDTLRFGMESTMEKYLAKIHVKGTQVIDDETDETIINTTGECIQKEGIHYIIYSDNIEGQIIKNMIKIGDNSVEVIKRGAVESKMCFAAGEKYDFTYTTSFGRLDMTINTGGMSIYQAAGEFKIHIEYDLYVGGVFTSHNKMFIRTRR